MMMLLVSGQAAAQQNGEQIQPNEPAAAQAVQPLKVAVMPIIADGYPKVQAQLYRDLTRQMSLSLNKTLQQAEYLEGEPVAAAMAESGFLYDQNEKALKHTADLLGADVIVGFSVPAMYQQYYYAWIGRGEGPVLQSYIRLKLWAYYRPLDKVIALSNTQQYFDHASTAGMLPSLAGDASYMLTKKADLKNLLKESIKIKKGDIQ